MKTEEQIREQVEKYRRISKMVSTPGDPQSIGSVVEAMAREKMFAAVIEELEWVLS